MSHLNLTTAEFERLLKVFGALLSILGITYFIVQLKFFQTSAPSAAWKAFSIALTSAILLFGIFSRVAWRWERLAKWMSRPIVHGIWKGELISNFGTVDGSRLIIPIFFV